MDEEYCSSFYSWFDKSGIISNVRTQLRYNLINALKKRDLDIKLGNNSPKSAKQYIFDLLIAEYLLNHNYAYSLSIFTSEAPLLINFNSDNPIFNRSSSSDNQQKFQQDYIFHTLESLGIEPTGSKGQCIINEYKENDVPLLLCILNCIKLINNKIVTKKKSVTESELYKNQEVQTVETSKKLFQEITKINNTKKKLIKQRDLFNAQLNQKENELKEQAVITEKQLLTLQDKLEQAQKLMDVYNIKEKQFSESKKQENLRILEKENELILKEKFLSQEALKLEKERDSYRKFEGDLKKLQEELLKVKREIPQPHSNNFRVKDVSIQTDFESFILSNRERNFLNQEKKDLNGLVEEQQSRIEQLTLKVVSLSRKLEEAQLQQRVNLHTPIIRVTNTNTIISETSSTEDILQDAKMRLRRLEEETMKADQYYLNYINNSSQ